MNNDYYVGTKSKNDINPVKIIVVVAFVAVIFAYLSIKLFSLQVLNQDRYISLASNNYIRYITQECPRGTIYDRNGIVLAEDVPTFHLYAIPNEIPEISHTAKLIEDLIGIDQKTLITKIEDGFAYAEILIKDNLSYEEKTRVEENEYKLKGIFVKEGFKRYYPNNESFCHSLGYTGVITNDDLQLDEMAQYQPNERVGQVGLERYYESFLHGEMGLVKQTVDVLGNVENETVEKEIVKGNNLKLSIDIRLQKEAEQILGENKGCIILMNAKNGELLTCASNPGFDPNFFSGPRPLEEWNQLIEKRAFFNIPSMGQYPPGSTFKPLISLFGLNNEFVTPTENIVCEGALNIPGMEDKYKCWVYPSAHGPINIIKAIKISCDVFFYKLADRFEVDSFIEFLKIYGGISLKTRVDLVSEDNGFLGSPEWKMKFKGQPWYRGDSMNLGIGQGYLSVTPLQMTKLYGKIASKGIAIHPHFLAATSNDETYFSICKPEEYEVDSPKISSEHYQTVLKGMHEATLYPGTASGLNNNVVTIAAKTGTAMAESNNSTIQHLWIISIFPYENPEMVALIMFENSAYNFAGDLAPFLKNFILYYYKLESEVN
ncbi:MAG: penicillin-binding protein 2 [Caldisericia bacterium]|nr:penicillin-binding protein 2 [Caldisericia bacterium]